jgi:hypothetical protein
MIAGLLSGAALASTPAIAASVPNGTVSVAALYNPTVNLNTSPANYTATFGNTFEISGSNGFSSVSGLNGTMNGTLSFAATEGTTINQALANFFVFNDGRGGFFNFSPTSVLTQTYSYTPGVSSSVGLYILGNVADAFQGFTPTPSSLSLSFNSTGGSPYSASATLSVPPAGAVPEPASWALMIVGFGLIGGAMRRRKVKTSVSFA